MAIVFLFTIVGSCFSVPAVESEGTAYHQQDAGSLSLINFFVDDDEVDDEDGLDDDSIHAEQPPFLSSTYAFMLLYPARAQASIHRHHFLQSSSRRIFLFCRKFII
jgi:hypothetical protein